MSYFFKYDRCKWISVRAIKMLFIYIINLNSNWLHIKCKPLQLLQIFLDLLFFLPVLYVYVYVVTQKTRGGQAGVLPFFILASKSHYIANYVHVNGNFLLIFCITLDLHL